MKPGPKAALVAEVVRAAREWRTEDRRFSFTNADGSVPPEIASRQFNRRERALDALAAALTALDEWEGA